jgi:SAM-dependent methyltransferase
MNLLKKIRRYYKTVALMYRSIDSFVAQPEITDLNPLYMQYGSAKSNLQNSVTLDIGCGETPRNPFNASQTYGLDIREDLSKNIRYADLTVEPLPFDENMFDFITAYDFLEHVPRVVYLPERRFSFIQLMNEIHRTLKPGGIFLSRTPFYPISSVFTDPTHVNVITADTFPMYFDDKHTWAKMYGFKGGFRLNFQAVNDTHLVTVLQKL